MLPQQYCLRWKYHHSNLQTMFSQLLDRGCFCDVTLACEGQLIRAHRVVLCACSTFFDAVLTNYASERDPIIIMKDVTFADVKSLIEFMYKGEINVEHANLASLLKTADDLKIKGLAEVSWRDDEDNGSIGSVVPPPVPDTEFIIHSPPLPPSHHRTHDGYSAAAATLDARCSPNDGDMERRNSSPNQVHNKQQHHLPSRLPMLTPIPPPSITIAAASGDHYLGPRRKRGRPPLDDAYDVFNVNKLTQLGGQLDSQRYLDESRIHSAKNDEQQRRHLTSAYQQHIHQQQRRQRQKLEQQQHATDSEDAEDTQTDPEWITSNLEVNVSECDVETIGPLENSDESQSAEQRERKIEKERMTKSPNSAREKTSTEEKLDTEKGSPKIERFNKKRSLLEKAKEHRQRENNEKQTTQSGDEEKMRRNSDQEENDEEPTVLPQPVEEIESVQQVLQQQQQQQISSSSVTATTTTPATIASPSDLPSTSSSSSSSHNDSQTKSINNSSHSNTHSHGAHHTTTHIPPPPPPAAHTHFTKYAPPEGGGYVLNEHGMLMTHDFPSHPVIGASNGNGDHEFIDIKMEDYDAADLRLTSEEMSQWQDVIKMDDYLAKGRRPQFWEEPFTRRVLDAIKNKRLEMKKAARILGVSYGTLYGRYREVYGCLKHPYSSTFRPSQSSQLAAVQPRFDIWPSPKRDTGILPPPLEIGKIRPKDLSELWARPQI